MSKIDINTNCVLLIFQFNFYQIHKNSQTPILSSLNTFIIQIFAIKIFF